ncbi:hypothetical protein K7432_010248 [Basidiobolus ranarum]|uniref:Uncharacterized protein n=1 Tax=Basidiobolus ranarum TaxID=34480 RepID=A0ABR2VW71_9FUNG
MIPEGTCNVKKEVLVSSDLEFITAIIKIATEDITSDKNSLLYWDIDKTYPFDFYEDEKKLSLALGYLTEDDNGSYASNLDTGSGGVLFEEKPTKLAGFRDKLKGSIKDIHLEEPGLSPSQRKMDIRRPLSYRSRASQNESSQVKNEQILEMAFSTGLFFSAHFFVMNWD